MNNHTDFRKSTNLSVLVIDSMKFLDRRRREERDDVVGKNKRGERKLGLCMEGRKKVVCVNISL